jgi:hypothetical protein
MNVHGAVHLHGDNGYYAVVEEEDRRLLGKRMPQLPVVLEPYREQLDAGVLVALAFSWYGLVDGLRQYGYQPRLANPAPLLLRGEEVGQATQD